MASLCLHELMQFYFKFVCLSHCHTVITCICLCLLCANALYYSNPPLFQYLVIIKNNINHINHQASFTDRPLYSCIQVHLCINYMLRWRLSSLYRDDFVYGPSQWETALQCYVVSYWLGTYTKWSLLYMDVKIWTLMGYPIIRLYVCLAWLSEH